MTKQPKDFNRDSSLESIRVMSSTVQIDFMPQALSFQVDRETPFNVCTAQAKSSETQK